MPLCSSLQSSDAVGKSIRPVKIEWWSAGVGILERDADLHMAHHLLLR